MSSPVIVRDLAAELKRFADDLSDTARDLRSALGEMNAAQDEINREFTHTAKCFAQMTLTGLQDEDFHAIGEVAAKIDELGTQGLIFFRDNLVNARASALHAVNQSLDKTVDAEGFQAALREKDDVLAAASSEAEAKNRILSAAKSELSTWKNQTTEDDLVELDEEIARKGGRRLDAENRGYYEVPSLLTAVWRYVTDPTYRTVRRTLEKFGHGKDGSKDAFADLAGFKARLESFKTVIADAQGVYDGAATVQKAAQSARDTLARLGDGIMTDSQMLDTIHAKVASDIKKSPDFMQALADTYAEDFPRNLAFLVAKLTTLATLEKGTQEKLAEIQKSHSKIVEQYEKLSRMQQSLKVRNVDMTDLRRKNDAYRAQSEHYARAARDSWNRTRDYSYDDFRSSGAAQRSGSTSLIEKLFLYQMLTAGNNRGDRAPERSELADNSRFTADLMGINRERAESAGLPPAVFDISKQTAGQMFDLGVNDYRPGDLGLAFDISSGGSSPGRGGVAFDIEEPPPPPPPSRPSSSGGSFGGGGSTFKIGGSRSSTGGGGSSFKIGGGSSRSSSRPSSSSRPIGGGGRTRKL